MRCCDSGDKVARGAIPDNGAVSRSEAAMTAPEPEASKTESRDPERKRAAASYCQHAEETDNAQEAFHSSRVPLFSARAPSFFRASAERR
jgi:hypothetical protein